ncbi:ankyrin repeat domain-containing protein, partial [Hydrogenophaga aromaticivorans]|uniref:ankyrin repeat domain-containing protein n=1 Tax=Hydrogenophaga aromaticivorans TaxID=2610898 RepID=UPI001B35BC1C
AERAAPGALTQAAPDSSNANAAVAPAAREPARNAATLRREAPAADRARSAAALPPLLAATAQGDPGAVRRLLATGTDVNTRDATGRTALMLAAQRGDAALIRLLLDAGAEPAMRDREGLSASDHATQTGQTAVLPLLR